MLYDQNKILPRMEQQYEIFNINQFFQPQNYKGLMNQQNQQVSQNNLEILTEQLICPITIQIMIDPVSIASGHTFERQAIQHWIKRGNKKNPVTGQIMKSTDLYPNKAIKNLIQKIPRIESRIKKQTISLETKLKNLQELWSQADISDSTIRRQKLKLGAQNETLKSENDKLKQEQNELKHKMEIIQKQNKQLQGQLNFAKIKFDKQLKLKDKQANQLKIMNQKAKTQNEKLTRQIKIIRSQLVKKDSDLRVQKQSYQAKIKQLQIKRRSTSRNISRDKQIPTLQLSRQKKQTKVLSKQKASNPQTIKQLISPKNTAVLLNYNNYRQRKFQSPASKNGSLTKSQRLTVTLPDQRQKNETLLQPSKWKKSPSKSIEKRPSIRELLNQQKNDLNKN